jgi:hypothetical protein
MDCGALAYARVTCGPATESAVVNPIAGWHGVDKLRLHRLNKIWQSGSGGTWLFKKFSSGAKCI